MHDKARSSAVTALARQLQTLETKALRGGRTRAQACREANQRNPQMKRLASSTVSDWLAGHSPPRDVDRLWALVEVLLNWADAPDRLDSRGAAWWTAQRRAWQATWELAHTPDAFPAPQAPPSQPERAVDRLHQHLGRHDSLPKVGSDTAKPLLLRVHPSIPLDQTHATSVQEPNMAAAAGLDRQLPTFVERESAEELREQLHTAGKDGGFVVLVGKPCVGKTRLLYETTREILPDFRLLVPDLGDGGLINDIAAADFPIPPLLIWLDELQRFLPSPHFVPDEQAGHSPLTARAVRQLLQSSTPVVIVGTLWPDYRTDLRAIADGTATGPPRPRYPHALDILTAATDLALYTFSPSERDDATRLADTDPRLATAVADPDYNITEALAGVPQLMRRYAHAPDAHQAVIHAAVDARRHGLRSPLTADLLHAVARANLTSLQPNDTWFDQALAELTSTGRRDDRATAPLIPLLSADRRTVLGYTVAGYLLQHLTRVRRTHRLTGVTWQALIDHATDTDDLHRLAQAAQFRMLLRIAESIYARFAAHDSIAALLLYRLLVSQGRTDEAIDALRPHSGDGGQGTALLVSALTREGHAEEAIEVSETLQSRATAGDEYAAVQLAGVLVDRGRNGEAIHVLRPHADTGKREAIGKLAWLLGFHPHSDGAIEAFNALRSRAEAGDQEANWRFSQVLALQGDFDQLQSRANAGDVNSAGLLVEFLAEHDRLDEASEAIQTLRLLTEQGNRKSAQWLISLQTAMGSTENLEKAIDVLRTAADDKHATQVLIDHLVQQQRVDEAIEILEPRVHAGDETAALMLANLTADLLAAEGRVDELRSAADFHHYASAVKLTKLLAAEGRVDELYGEVHAGTFNAAPQLMRLLSDRGVSVEEVMELFQHGIEPDTPDLTEAATYHRKS
ncbi:hypothetical protein GCM10011583_71600 [Streptomyces camponoticapitis]|uniref:Tetratricopeptide repeat protein n=1 Tax=Streptomyces camponoticapitis TaxID=1616125 RepID=A0ABQ2EZQ1_9ACTN|nr:hypothetical protein [Streptomyces camponoticapitis]GGK29358.1 hypothetical protein GCM10011583_71600 [Streptomyces camponoticapitis]